MVRSNLAGVRSSILLIAAASVLGAGPPDPVDLIRKAAAAFDENRTRAVNFLSREAVTVRQFNKKGKELDRDSRVYEIVYLEGETYHKLVARDGKPLGPLAARDEELKLEQEAVRRQGKPLHARLAERVASRDRAQVAYHRIPELHRVRLESEEVYGGRPVWVLTAEPRPEARPKTEIDNFTHSLRLKMWVDQERLLFHRVEALSLRAAWNRPAGNRLEMEFEPFEGTVWLVKRVYQRAPLDRDSRPAVYQDTEQVYSDFRKFQADSKLVPIE